ncbi:hypothetical protein AB0B28_03445 [Glycomyces sp. NPDC046736]|uniref:hypothetical protein n=1 Tax=Glycomyces sp. NPDC046736 TaxID=3155615 RepID=UPI00340BF65F
MNLNSETFGPIRRVLAMGGLAVAAAAALSGCGFLDDAGTDTDEGEVSNAQLDAAGDASPGDCLPEEVLASDGKTFAVDCSGAEAFWTITAIEADPGVTASGGDIADTQAIYDVCGTEVGAQLPGKPWTDWNMIYDQTTGSVDYLFCVEAIDQPNAEGVVPVVPSAAGECFSSAEWNFGTFPCDSPAVDSTVVQVVEIDQAEWETVDAETVAMEQCTGDDWTYYIGAVDQFGRTAAVYCTN